MRIYFDENFPVAIVNGFREFQNGRPAESVEVLHIAQEFGRGAPDEEWIPKVAQEHGVVVTQDENIRRTKAQWTLCQEHKIGIIFLRSPKKKRYTYWMIVAELIKHWEEIKVRAMDAKRPFAYVATPRSTGLSEM